MLLAHSATRGASAFSVLREPPYAGEPSSTASLAMPPKVGELIADLKRAGFVDRGVKSSHSNFAHRGLKLTSGRDLANRPPGVA